MHAPTRYRVSATSLVELAALMGNFSDGDVAYVEGTGALVYQTAAPVVPPIGSTPSVAGGTWSPQLDLVISEVTREYSQMIQFPTQLTFRIPVGCYFAAHPDDVRVFHIAPPGPTTTELSWGLGPGQFIGYYNGQGNPQPNSQQPATVQDVSSGITLATPFAPPGVIRIRWVERTVAFAPRIVAAVRLDAGVPNMNVAWNSDTVHGGPLYGPNAITVPPAPLDFVPEIWKRNIHGGGLGHLFTPAPMSPPMGFTGHGKRYMPYFRGPQVGVADPNTLLLSAMYGGNTGRKTKYKVCYYSPSLRARSDFATETILQLNGSHNDRHNADTTLVRSRGVVAINPF